MLPADPSGIATSTAAAARHGNCHSSCNSSSGVCVVAPLTELSGNLNTARRIASFVDGTVVDALPRTPSTAASPPLQQHHDDGDGVVGRYRVCILIHALRSGRVVFPDIFCDSNDPRGGPTPTPSTGQGIDCQSSTAIVHSAIVSALPAAGSSSTTDNGLLSTSRPRYILVFGGTDVNEFANDDVLRGLMGSVIQRVDVVVCFSASLKAAAMQRWPDILAGKAVVICPQAVALQHRCVSRSDAQTGEQQPLSMRTFIMDNELCRGRWKASRGQQRPSGDGGGDSRAEAEPPFRFVLLPGGIRCVKDPLFAIEAWSLLQTMHGVHDVVLVLVGPLLEERVSQRVLAAVDAMDAVVWHPGVEQSALLECMQHRSTMCLLNTSRSEGQPQSVLEAMWAGTLVVARDIPANAELLAEGRGLLVASPAELAQTVADVASLGGAMHPAALSAMTEAAARHVREHHAIVEEEKRYRQLVSCNEMTSTVDR